MWAIFWSIFWKSLLTWIVIFFAIFVWGCVQAILSGFETLEDSLVNTCANLWLCLGTIAGILSAITGTIMLIVEIWT